MAETEQPQIYLITPSEFELSTFSNQLAKVLDTVDIACLRLLGFGHSGPLRMFGHFQAL